MAATFHARVEFDILNLEERADRLKGKVESVSTSRLDGFARGESVYAEMIDNGAEASS
jgi:hypothetical protein